MNFNSLLQFVAQSAQGEKPVKITADSRQVEQGSVFVAIAGNNAHGNTFVDAAMEAGAAYIVCENAQEILTKTAQKHVCIVEHENTRNALWQLASARYGTQNIWARGLRVIGLTGTNGKTTTAYLLEHLFTRLGFHVGVMGTVNYRWQGYEEAAALTTPDSLTVHRILAEMAAAGVTVVIMEVSSHALEQERVGGVDFAGAVFTNLTQDHLDFHATMEAYFASKAQLFTQCPLLSKSVAVNSDDAWGKKLLQVCPTAFSYGLEPRESDGLHTKAQHVAGTVLAMSPEGLHLHMQWGEESWELRTPLVGTFNAANILATQTIALGLGVSVQDLQHLQDFYGVCGRLERVDNAMNFAIFVDYAHTPDALVNVLQALRGAGFAKIITVFGCGGNRDTTKRPLMGKAVAKASDVAILTSDNPRNEEPQTIIDDVLQGLKEREGLTVMVEADRRTATQKAMELLLTPQYAGAAVLIAGKGHEDYQIIQDVKYPYSDQKTVKELATVMAGMEKACV